MSSNIIRSKNNHNINNSNNNLELFNSLSEYMLYPELMNKSIKYFYENSNDKYLSNKLRSNEKTTETKQYEKQENNYVLNNKTKPFFFIPKHEDKLFWCFYYIKNGDVNYETIIPNINMVIEKKYKIEYVEKIRKEKNKLKKFKFATLSSIENMLVNEKKIDIPTFLTLCVLENINVIMVKKQTYYELVVNENEGEKVYMIYNVQNQDFNFNKKSSSHHSSNETYRLEEYNPEKIEDIRKNLFKIDNLDKPIRSIGYYKIDELVDFCKKLGIETIDKIKQKTKCKKDLYEALIQYF